MDDYLSVLVIYTLNENNESNSIYTMDYRQLAVFDASFF